MKAKTEKRDFITSIRLPQSYRDKVEVLADKDYLKPSAYMARAIMMDIDKRFKKNGAKA